MAITYVPASGTPTANMASLQTALNAAAPGDTLTLTAGGFYDGTLTLPTKLASAARITITSNAATASLPAAGVRVNPATHGAFLPVLRVVVNNAACIKTCDPSAGVANGYTISCLEFINNTFGGSELISLGSTNNLLTNKQDTAAKCPGFITVDRCYIHGLPATGGKRGIGLNGHDLTVRECYISDCWKTGQDAQAISGANGTGGYIVTNNYLEAGAENFMMGGQDPLIPNLIPTGLTFTRNDCIKPISWRTDGIGRQVKNIFELKNFSDATIRGNRFFYCWTASQVGYAIVLTPVNQDGSNNQTVVRNVLFEYNHVAHAPGGVSLTAHDAQSTNRISQRTSNITIRHNLFTDIGTAWGQALREVLPSSGSLVNVFEGILGLTIDHNTFISAGLNANTYFAEYNATKGYPQHTNYVYRNNLARRASFGCSGSNSSEGTTALQAYAAGYAFLKNALAGGTASRYPTGNFFPTVADFEAAFVSYATGNYTIVPGHAYATAGTDGAPLGANITAIEDAYRGGGAPVTCTYTVAPTSVAVAVAGVSGTLTVTTASGCFWSATSNASWITVTSGSTGTGSGTVGYTVAANTGTARTGSITVAGGTVTFSQAAPPICTYSISPTAVPVVYTGASGSITVTTQSGCGWTAVSNSTWITITSGASGTGSGSVGWTAAANGSAARVGTITVGGTTVTLSQAAPPVCTYAVTPTSVSTDATDHVGLVNVTTQTGCSWTAVSNAAWITVPVSGAGGTGSGSVTFTLTANTGAARTGTLTVALATVTVTQEAAPVVCAYSVTPLTRTVDAAEHVGLTATVSTTAECAWTAVSNATWISITAGTSGTGSGTTTYTVTEHEGLSARTGTLTIAARTVTVTQTGVVCTASTSLSSTAVQAAAGATILATVTMSADACTWTATETASWITLSAASGTGSGTTTLTLAENTTTTQRSGTVQIAGESFVITQAGAIPVPPTCSYAVDPISIEKDSTAVVGGTLTVTASHSSCAWTAVANDAWLHVTGGASGTGNGTVTTTIDANASTTTERTGTFTVAGLTVTVTQDHADPAPPTYTYTVDPLVVDKDYTADATITFAVVTTPALGPWTAVSNAAWITVDSGTPGTGDGTVAVTIDENPNPDPARTGTLTIAGHTVTVNQAAEPDPAPLCSYTVSPTTAEPNAAGGVYTIDVVASDPACVWTAVSNDAWIALSSDGETGSGSLTLVVAAYAGTSAERVGTATIAGETVTVTQAQAACTFTVGIGGSNIKATGGRGTIPVDTQGGCAWTAVSNDTWITVKSGASGTGDGYVTYTVAKNDGAARTGSLTIAGQTVAVRQEAPRRPRIVFREGSTMPVTADYSSEVEYQAALEDWQYWQTVEQDDEIATVSLSWSDDGGHTWSNEHRLSIGQLGEYRKRLIWNRLGRSRDRVFKIVMSDAVKWRVLGATVDVERGTN